MINILVILFILNVMYYCLVKSEKKINYYKVSALKVGKVGKNTFFYYIETIGS